MPALPAFESRVQLPTEQHLCRHRPRSDAGTAGAWRLAGTSTEKYRQLLRASRYFVPEQSFTDFNSNMWLTCIVVDPQKQGLPVRSCAWPWSRRTLKRAPSGSRCICSRYLLIALFMGITHLKHYLKKDSVYHQDLLLLRRISIEL